VLTLVTLLEWPTLHPGRMAWDWKALGDEVENARRGTVPHWEAGHQEAAARFHRAVEAVWPPGFFAQLERCKRGEPCNLNDILGFIEACPKFFRSGYILAIALRWLGRPPRTEAQADRMRAIVLDAVSLRLWLPFREIPSLARAVDSPGLRAQLLVLASHPDAKVCARAAMVLDRLPGPSWNPERAALRRRDDRVGTMIRTAQKSRSATLLRSALATDPLTLSTLGRRYLSVAFEFAMNWDLLPKEELLPIAQRLDGCEMESVWRFALRRQDGPGDRARWLLAQIRRR
jgi:hypothetical protein